MSKAVLISIKPEWCEKIIEGKKTLEIRKTEPKLEKPFKVYIYCTYGTALIEHRDEVLPDMLIEGQKVSKGNIWGNCSNGKVIGEFVCKGTETLDEKALLDGMDEISDSRIEYYSCVSIDELLSYKGNKPFVYGWHISDLVIYDKPKELSEFNAICPNMKPDGTRENGNCPCGKYTHDFDEITGKTYCTRRKTKPPQSWCYVEEASGNV